MNDEEIYWEPIDFDFRGQSLAGVGEVQDDWSLVRAQ